ncbi:sialidase family protein [Methylobacterium nodulans]|uniref:BNR repeat-containing glycosyl hydrolase n=1 Tax=Methylobacterium nodulans (strain LMG 21967 / CNCM I-2342 / ORS 2060) TaxID=460265 RepID=B8IX73_METNO|nr:exo-alpha-sialidase [Methylobacterium nodulans]ACL63114.1 BNR repeat-containing glycosyl hydrolase [Methylobacterium nodulans ORS 2060]
MLDIIAQPQARTGTLQPVAGDPVRLETFIPSLCVQNHAANLMPLANGDLACVWFGGTQEGMADISVYFSRLAKGSDAWSPAEKLSDDPARSEQNPILFPAPTGDLWLIWTAQVSGNQDTAFVRRRLSRDHGRSWGPIETLFPRREGCGTFVRQPPVVLANGDWLLPIFHCPSVPGAKWVGDDDTSAVKISSDAGRTWHEVAVPDSTGCVHMSIMPLDDGTLLALFRSRWADAIYESRSTDGGATWSAPVPTALPNNNSSIQATRLANGHLALVYNAVNAEAATERRASLYDEIEDEAGESAAPLPAAPGKRTAFWGTPRAPLTLAISEDGGRTWPHRRDVETGDGYCMTNNSRDRTNRELSYPSVAQTPDGALHVAFTYHRQAIKYVRLSEGWVSAGG